MPMSQPVIGGGGGLIRNWIQSPDFLAGVRGWRIARDGSAEFNDVTVRGTLHLQSGNATLDIDVLTTIPAILFNPDVAQYSSDGIVWALDQDGGAMEIRTPAESAVIPASIFLYSKGPATGTTAEIDLAAQHVRTIGYGYQFGANTAQSFAPSAAVGPGNNTTCVSVTMSNLVVGYTYRVTAVWHSINIVTPVAVPGNRVTMHLAVGGVFALAACRIIAHNTTLGQFGGTLIGYHVATATSHTYALILQHEAASTAGTASASGVSDGPLQIAVEGWGNT
jgi:hypothetical protein